MFFSFFQKLKVLRIKFLGDCYYCVAGLPPDPVAQHAEACVDLGLKMISIIADIRYDHNNPYDLSRFIFFASTVSERDWT
jgi:adenylate cyclase